MIQRISVICQWVLSIVGVAPLLITIVFLVWANDKGFDITDEGFYLLSSQFPEEVKMWTNVAHFYLSILYRFSCQNIVAFRLLGLVLNIGSAVVFYIGFHRFMVRLRLNEMQGIMLTFMTISFIILGAMLNYVWYLSTPSYNLLNAIVLNACSGFMFLALSRAGGESMSSLTTKLALFATGLCIGVSFFVKFPTSTLLFTLFSLLLVCWRKYSLKGRLKSFSLMAFGVIAWSFIHFTIIQSPSTWWQTLTRGLEGVVVLGAGHGIHALYRYFHECRDLVKIAVLDFWKFHIVLMLGFTILFILRRVYRDIVRGPSLLIFAMLPTAAWQSYRRGFGLGGVDHLLNITRFYLSWIIFLMFCIIIGLIYYRRVKYLLTRDDYLKQFLLIAVMFCLPFVGAVGTANYIYANTFYQMAPWFGLLLILLGALSALLRNQWVFTVGVLIVSCFACSQIVSGCLYGPYRLKTGLLGQTEATRIGYPSTLLKLDPATSEFFNKIRQLASENGFKPGDDVLGFFDLPGGVFALGGRSPGNPWYNCGYKGSRAFAEKALSLVPPERLKRAFIMETSGNSECMPDLSKFGINFPADYILFGELIWPITKETVQLWKPRFLDEKLRS